jgi:hypothetical protein
MSPSRVLLSGLVVALTTCVPAGTDENPHGGAGIVVRPSPASRGQPVATTDGWTIFVDRLAVLASVSLQDASGGYTSQQALYMFSAASDQELVIRALPAGPVRIGLGLTGFENEEMEASLADPPAMHGVDPDVVARFERTPDTVDPDATGRGYREIDGGYESSSTAGLGFGPVVVIAAHAEKAGRIVTFDVSLGQPETGGKRADALTVRSNTLTTLDVPLDVEALFTNEAGAIVFDDIAAADVDGNGQVSPDELRRLNVPPCPGCTEAQKAAAIAKAVTDGDELAARLIARAAFLFGL